MADDQPGYRPIPNPYITGNPVRGREVFFGREDDFLYARQRLMAEKNGVVLLFVGARRSGKTSIMYQILEGRLGSEFLPVFVDMQRMVGVHGDREFYSRIAELIIEGIGDQRLVLDYYDFKEGNPVIAFDQLLGDVQRLYPERRIVVLVDETEILHTKMEQGELSTAVLTYMASILESRRVSFCFTGSPGLSQAPEDEWRRLTGKGDYREISFLSRSDCLRLIREPVEGYVTYEEGVAEAIYTLTYGQPFYTQVICTYAVDFLNSSQRNRLTAEDLAEVVRTLIDNPPPQLYYEWDNLPAQEKLALSLLSEVSTGHGHGITAAELAELIRKNDYPLALREEALHISLESLFNRKWLERDEQGAYHIRIDLFRQWIKRARSIWRLVEETAPKSRRRLYGAAAAAVVLLLVGVGVALRACQIEVTTQQDRQLAASQQPVGPAVGGIYVTAAPAEVEIWLDGQRQEATRTPVPLDSLAPGEHLLELRREGYRPWRDTLTVRAGKVEYPQAQLVRLTGVLRLAVKPADAQVAIRGERSVTVGAATDSVVLPTGEYQVAVEKAGFVPRQQRVSIAEDREYTLTLDLSADVGRLTVRSEPSGAAIFLDGQPTGKQTPQTLTDLPVGPVQVTLTLADYQRVDTAAAIIRDREATLELALRIQPATLVLSSVPTGAAVFVDEEPRPAGTTPCELVLKPSRHDLRLELGGYEPAVLMEQLTPGQRLVRSQTLKPLFGRIRVARPLKGTVVVDGTTEHEVGEGEFEVPVGKHDLMLKETGQHQTIEITQGATTIVKFEPRKE